MATEDRAKHPVVLDLGRLGQGRTETDSGWLADEARPRPPKRLMSLRIDADVVEYFRSLGPGWQSRMNAVLRTWMEHRRSA